MILASRNIWIKRMAGLGLGLLWLLALLWPMMGIKPEGLEFGPAIMLTLKIGVAGLFIIVGYQLRESGVFGFLEKPVNHVTTVVQNGYNSTPKWIPLAILLVFALAYPILAPSRYAHDVANSVLTYICLGLGLNVVIGLCGLLDLGYIAFYGVGAYTYALLNLNFGMSFWVSLPFAAVAAAIAGCIVGYPTLRMRGDYLAIVTLGFGEIIRILINNWMSLTNGPNGIMSIEPPTVLWIDGLIKVKSLGHLYYIILGITILTIVAVYHLNYSRIGRAWEAIREDETAAEIMGVNTFRYKLLAYAMGAVFAGFAGAFFSARMRFVSPESFTFLESAMVLAMVVLGGMGSIPGVIVGCLALIALPEVFREFDLYRMLIFGGVMTVMMLVRPKGLIPAARVGKRSEEEE